MPCVLWCRPHGGHCTGHTMQDVQGHRQGMNAEKRVRRAADKMSSHSFAIRQQHQECKRRKCDSSPVVNGYCYDHWRKSREK